MKTARKTTPLPPKKKQRVLFPTGEVRFADVFFLDFSESLKQKNYVIGRFLLKGIDGDRYKDFTTNVKPFIKKNLGIIPGIRTAFIQTKKNGLEFAIAIDFEKSDTLFTAAEGLKILSKEPVLSMDHIKMLLRAHIQRMGVLL
jgi:hypothetical protein